MDPVKLTLRGMGCATISRAEAHRAGSEYHDRLTRAKLHFGTAPAPVRKPQPIGPNSSSGVPLSTTMLRSVAMQCLAKEDCPKNRLASGSPEVDWTAVVPSARRPPWRTQKSAQYEGRPCRQLPRVAAARDGWTKLACCPTKCPASPRNLERPVPACRLDPVATRSRNAAATSAVRRSH